jgi:hypothetical protein
MKVQIITTRNSGENLRQEEFDIVKEAGKFNRLDRANLTIDTTSITRVFLFKRGVIQDICYVPSGYRVYLFWDRELCDLEVFPFQN